MGFPVDGAPRRGPALRRTPRGLLIPACIGLAFVAIPVGALAVRVPWSNLGGAAGDASLGTALRLSLLSGVAATALALTLGVPLGWLLARGTFRGRSLVRVAALLPLALPPVVGGLALLMAFGRRGVLGAPLEDLGIVLPFTLTATILAQTFVALPFVVLAVEAAVGAVPGEPEEVAASLGAGPMAVFWRVTLPLARPGVVAGAALAFARALGEFGATITFAGSVRGRTQTLPLAVYDVLQRDRDGAVLLSLVLLAVSALFIFSLRGSFLGRSAPAADGSHGA